MITQYKILIADDHPMLRKGIFDSLSAIGYTEVFMVENGAKALEMIITKKPDVALLDIEMPYLNGFEVVKKAVKAGSKTRFIILTSYREKGFVLQAQKLNLSGYLLKDEPFSEVHTCIKKVAQGGTYFSPSFNAIVNDELNPELEKVKFLSPSERTIIRLIARGFSSKEIGDQLSISHRTVQKHRSNIIVKLDLNTAADALTLWVIEHKQLIEIM